MNIRSKIGAIFFTLIFIFIIHFFYSNYYLRRVIKETEHCGITANMVELALQIRRHEKNIILRGKKEYADKVSSYLEKLSSEINDYREKAYNKKNAEKIAQLLVQSEIYNGYMNEYIEEIERNKKRMLGIESEELISIGRVIENLCKEIRDDAITHRTYSMNSILRSEMIVLILSIIAVLITFEIISRTVVGPVRKLQFISREIGKEGVSEKQLHLMDEVIKGRIHKDEIGELTEAYKGMVMRTHQSYLVIRDQMREIEDLCKLKSEFTSVVSHELRTPLTVIKEGIDLVLDGAGGEVNGEQRELLDIAKRNVDRLANLISDVLDFSKLTSKKVRLEKKKVLLNEVIDSVLNSYRLLIEKKELGLVIDLDATKDFSIEIDPDRINRVIVNILDNAVKFTHKGKITVAAKKEEKTNSVIVSIGDTGIGIRKEDIPKLFQPFTQVGQINGKGRRGTGLGLAICKEIIEQSGGKIWINSRYGKGSSFFFTLPIEERRRERENYKLI